MTETRNQSDSLLTPELMRQLDRLDVMSRKMLAGKMQGERRSKKRGQSVEFADYRNYVVGDDLRFIDWNLYARLDKLFLRLFMEEEDLSVTVAIDVTGSMNYGEPNKLHYARQLAAALGYIGLVNYNRVGMMAFTEQPVDTIMGLRGRRPIPRMLNWLDAIGGQSATAPANGNANSSARGEPGHLANVCKRIALMHRQPGVVVLISDFFDKGELADALRFLALDRFDVYALQVLCPQEVDPVAGQIVGDLRLRDIEDGDVAEVSVSPALVKRYKANLQAYCQYVKDQATRRGIAYLATDTSVPVETVMLQYLRRRGLLA